ncbi:MAG: SGNH/GDSL hydrolase family protein, partial [Beijerinckiaceae bacterium]
MVFGSARTVAKMMAAGLAWAALLPAPISATEVDSPCQAPTQTVANTAPLPHLEQLLRAKKPVRVLAIGSSSTVGVGASSPTANYPSRLGVELGKT